MYHRALKVDHGQMARSHPNRPIVFSFIHVLCGTAFPAGDVANCVQHIASLISLIVVCSDEVHEICQKNSTLIVSLSTYGVSSLHCIFKTSMASLKHPANHSLGWEWWIIICVLCGIECNACCVSVNRPIRTTKIWVIWCALVDFRALWHPEQVGTKKSNPCCSEHIRYVLQVGWHGFTPLQLECEEAQYQNSKLWIAIWVGCWLLWKVPENSAWVIWSYRLILRCAPKSKELHQWFQPAMESPLVDTSAGLIVPKNSLTCNIFSTTRFWSQSTLQLKCLRRPTPRRDKTPRPAHESKYTYMRMRTWSTQQRMVLTRMASMTGEAAAYVSDSALDSDTIFWVLDDEYTKHPP